MLSMYLFLKHESENLQNFTNFSISVGSAFHAEAALTRKLCFKMLELKCGTVRHVLQ